MFGAGKSENTIAPGGIRTPDYRIRNPVLYPLSYRRSLSFHEALPRFVRSRKARDAGKHSVKHAPVDGMPVE